MPSVIGAQLLPPSVVFQAVRLMPSTFSTGSQFAASAWMAYARGEVLMDRDPATALTELDRAVGEARDRPLGAGVTYAVMLHGIAQHHAYHAGQIALLRKSFG